MATKQQLKEALDQFGEGVRVVVDGDYSLVGIIVSSLFRGQDEADRQEAVWRHLRERLGQDELRNIEFIHTDTPEEAADA